MMRKISLTEANNRELAERIVVRLFNQSEPEIKHVLRKLFPASPAMRIYAMANDFAEKRESIKNEFFALFDKDDIDVNIFNTLSSAEKDPSMIMARKQFDPTKFNLVLTCHRTPFKEFFEECATVTCEDCITSRILKFDTNNETSKEPWSLFLEKVQQRRLDVCKQCGWLLGKKDDINMQNERMLYTCSNCGHKGWVKAK